MIIVKIKAGLGNQLFQYAFGRALSLRRGEPLFLDTTYYDNQPERDAKREYLLSMFKIEASPVSPNILKKYTTPLKIFLRKLMRHLITKDSYAYIPSLIKSRSTYYEGYWLNQKYFIEYKDILQKELSLSKDLGVAAQASALEINTCVSKNETPVSLNIRRGDFVSNPNSAFNGVLSIPYYEKAFQLLVDKNIKNICIFVFSDDIEWAKNNLKLPCSIRYVSGKNISDYEELLLISMCSHNIIANSTFSWWGAWLNKNPNKIVVATKQWLKDRTTEELDITPKEWITI